MKTSQVGIIPNLWRGFTSSINQRTTFQLMNTLSLTREINRSSNWQALSVSLARLTRTSLLHRKSYSYDTLDWKYLVPTCAMVNS